MEVYVNLRISNRCLMLLLQPVFLCQMAVHVCTCSICRLVWFSKRRSSTNQLTLFFFSSSFLLQMAKFRSLLFSSAGEQPRCMCNNYRPPQPIKGRKVRSNFK